MILKNKHQFYLQLRSFTPAQFYHSGCYSISTKIYHKNENKQRKYAHPQQIVKKQSRIKQKITTKINETEHESETPELEIQSNGKTFYLNSKTLFELTINKNELVTEVLLTFYLNQHRVKEPEPKKKKKLENRHQESAARINQRDYENSAVELVKEKRIVDQCYLRINVRDLVNGNFCENFRRAVFPNRQYFSTLYFVIDHAKIGYNFTQQTKIVRSLPTITETSVFQTKHLSESTFTIINNIKQYYSSILDFYEDFIIKQFYFLQNILTHFFILKKQINRDYYDEEVLREYYVKPFFVKSQEELLEIYEAEDQKEVLYLIYLESRALQVHLLDYWGKLIRLYANPMVYRLFNFWLAKSILSQNEGIRHQILNKTDLSKKKSQVSTHEESIQSSNFSCKLLPNFTRFVLKKRHFSQTKFIPEFYEMLPIMKIFESSTLKTSQQINIDHNTSFMNKMDTLFILVHGYHGNQYDLQLMRAGINGLYFTNTFTVSCDREKFNEPIQKLGKFAAQEIIREIQKKRHTYFPIRSINFIGFSLGGVIIRSSLKYLSPYFNLFNVFITLSSPHLGIIENKSCLVRTYANAASKFKKNEIMRELLLKRQISQNSLEECYLEKLASENYLQNFKVVLFIGSRQDLFVPLYSSTLQYKHEDPRILKMQKGIHQNCKNLHLIITKFKQKRSKSNLIDFLLPNNVHLSFISDISFMHMLLSQYCFVF